MENPVAGYSPTLGFVDSLQPRADPFSLELGSFGGLPRGGGYDFSALLPPGLSVVQIRTGVGGESWVCGANTLIGQAKG